MLKKKKNPAAVKSSSVKQGAFIKAFIITANLTEAAKAAGVDRRSHYNWLQDDEKYRQKFTKARLEAMEALEDDAVERARKGVLKPVFYQGKAVGAERVYSDGLMMFILRGGLPEKYRQQGTMEITGKNGGPIEIVQRLAQARKRTAKAD